MASETVIASPPDRHAARRHSVVVRCRIESSRAWLRWTRGPLWQQVRRALSSSLGPWLEALELPVDVRFRWHADRGDDWPGDAVCRLLFDGRDSLFVRLPPEEAADAEVVAGQLAAGVFEARASLVTPAVAERLREAAQAAADGEPGRRLVARELVRRGMRPAQAWQSESALDPEAPQSHFDLVVDQDVIGLRVEVADTSRMKDQPGDRQLLPELLGMLAEAVFDELGLMLPPVELDGDSSLPAAAIRIWMNEMPLPLQTGLAAGEILVNDTPERLALLGVPAARAAIHPASGAACSIVAASARNIAGLDAAGLTSWGPAGFLFLALSAAARRHAGSLWTLTATDAALLLLRERFGPLIDAAQRRFDRVLLTRVLRSLLDEEVGVRDLPAILEAMLAVDSTSSLDQRQNVAFPSPVGNIVRSQRAAAVVELGVDDWVGCVRTTLARYLSYRYTEERRTSPVYELAADIETQLEAAVSATGGLHALQTPESYLRLFRAIDAQMGKVGPYDARPVILTTRTLRRALRELITKDFPRVKVLCREELSPSVDIQPVARITWPASDPQPPAAA